MAIVRKTKSVHTVLQLMKQTGEALSVVDLVNRLDQEMNKTTVYRILERLEDEGILHSFQGKDGLKWYAQCQGCSTEQHTDTHPHFQCAACGKTRCLPLEVAIPNVPNVKIESASLLLTGLCEDCCTSGSGV